MAWTWIRPVDPTLLDGRPLLDVGIGDGQTVAALAPSGMVVGVDRSLRALRAASRMARRLAAAQASSLPFADATFEVVLAADLLHHLDDDGLTQVAQEASRVLRPGGRLVAWWWQTPGASAPDAPRFPRSLEQVTALLQVSGLRVESVDLLSTSSSGPTTVALAAWSGS